MDARLMQNALGDLVIVTPTGESLLIDSGYPDNNGRDRDRILQVAREVAKRSTLEGIRSHSSREIDGICLVRSLHLFVETKADFGNALISTP